MSFRSTISDFTLANPIYVGAVVTFYEVDESGAKTAVLATLYAAPTGTTTLANPQVLDSEGKFVQPVYFDTPVVAEVVGSVVGSHETGIIHPRGIYRGNWATGTLYQTGDTVKDGATEDLYVVADDYTSGANVAADVSAGHLVMFAPVASVLTAATTATAAASAASGSASAAAGSASAADGSASAAATDADDADTARIAAEAAQTAAEAAQAAAAGYAAGLNLPSLVGNGLNFLRANAGETGYESITPGAVVGALGLARRNWLLNGNFDVWQRGAGGISASGFCSDRWYMNLTGTAATSRQDWTPGDISLGFESKHFLRVTVSAIAAGSGLCNIRQRIEDVRSLAGQTATISFWAKADAAKVVGARVIQHFGSGGTPSADVTTEAGTVNLTTGWQRFTLSVAVPSITGKTIGTFSGGDNYLELRLDFADPTAYAGALDGQTGIFDIAAVQIEAGDEASAFEQRFYADELRMCQRYYEFVSWTVDKTTYSLPTIGTINVPFMAEKRTLPTHSGSTADPSDPGTAYSDVKKTYVTVMWNISAASNVGGGIGFDAEL